MSTEKTFMDDRESLQALINNMPKIEREQYLSYGTLMLESGFPNRKLILYTIKNGQPSNVTILTLGSFSMDSFTGPHIELLYENELTTIDIVPTRFLNRDIFFHVPQKFELKWKGKHSKNKEAATQFIPHYAVLIKILSRPHLKIEGHTHCVRMNEFKELFPSTQIRY